MTTPRLSAVASIDELDGTTLLGVAAKRTYTVTAGMCALASSQVPLVEGPRALPDGGKLSHDNDVALGKPLVDVIINGHVWSHGAGSVVDASIHVGSLRRAIRVFGDRRCERDTLGALRFTPPTTFDRLPLAWERAYGGCDLAAKNRYGDPAERLRALAGVAYDPRFGIYGYSRNPLGRGYIVEPSAEALAALELPNFEEPSQLLTPETLVCAYARRWPAAPPPACTGWLAYNVFPRTAHLGFITLPYDLTVVRPEDFHEVRAGVLTPEAVSPRTRPGARASALSRQGSAVGMRATEIAPGAPAVLHHLHPRSRAWAFRLPTETPEMFLRAPGGEPQRLTPKIRTVLIEPDEDRVSIVWVGETRADAPCTPERLATVEHAVRW